MVHGTNAEQIKQDAEGLYTMRFFCPVHSPPRPKRKMEPESWEGNLYATANLADHSGDFRADLHDRFYG